MNRSVSLLKRLKPVFSHLQTRTMSTIIDLNQDKTVCQLTRPGWSFDDYAMEEDLIPFLKIWRILPLIDWSREYSFNAGLMECRKLETTHYTYVKCLDLQRKLEYYDFLDLGNQAFGYGIMVKSVLANVGRTSCQLDHHVLHAKTGRELFMSSIVYVCVDKSTRNVTSWPEWWSSLYKTKVSGDCKPLRLALQDAKPPPIGSHITKLPLRVLPGDLDYYGHCNNTSYLRYTSEGVLTAFNHGALSSIRTRRNLENAVRSIEVDYIGDCVEGDNLDSETWEDPADPGIIWTRILKNKEVIFVQKLCVQPVDSKL